MTDAEIRSLTLQPPDRSLDRLEADIWAGVAAQSRALANARLIASCQAGVLALAIIGVLSIGRSTIAPADEPWLTAPGAALAPSTLLIGADR
jgi:hypothetical protein